MREKRGRGMGRGGGEGGGGGKAGGKIAGRGRSEWRGGGRKRVGTTGSALESSTTSASTALEKAQPPERDSRW